MTVKDKNLKQRFMDAIISGELGTVKGHDVVVSMKDFKRYFSDIKTQYIASFLPAAVIETGQHSATHTRFVFRIRKGLYRVHADAIAAHRALMNQQADEVNQQLKTPAENDKP